ncbi:MAG: TonB-dependent receptor domain-containing protein [Pseudomonadota bacterium]
MRRVVSGSGLRRVLLGSLATSILVATAAPASAAGEKPIAIPAGPLEQALGALSAQTGDQLVFAPELVAGRRAPAVAGRYSAEDALARLLAGSGIAATRAGPRVIVLKARAPAGPAPAAPPEAPGERPFATADPARADPPAPVRTAPVAAAEIPTVAEVRVTGTHIRGGSPAAPVLVVDQEAFLRSGHATVAGALQALPQNFGGESTDATAAVRADPLSTNSGYGVGINLRGLGSDATLVLVNGRRLAGSGNRGDFADVSSLPAIAVERVEVLLDGASALYGSDAVGGVVNVILRKDLDGGEVRLRAGSGDNGPREGLAAVAVGRTWEGGRFVAAYEGYRREALAAAKRRFTATADLTGLGGADHRDSFSYPGNVVRTDPVTAAIVPFWAIPAGSTGVGLRPGDFQAGVVNRFNQNQGLDVLPDQRRHSAWLALEQDLSETLTVSGDLRYGFRRARTHTQPPTATLAVGRGNPFFVSPNGAASNQIQYSFGGLAPNPLATAGVESLAGSLGAELTLPRDWRVDGYGAFAQETIETTQTGGVHSGILAEALGNAADNPATAYSAARDGFFNPYASVPGGNNPATVAAITSAVSKSRYRSQVGSLNLQADGALFRLPSGPVRAALGAQARRETFRARGSNYASTPAPVPTRGFTEDRTVASAFAEVHAPLVAEDPDRRGLHRLEVSAAVRAERYSDFGTTVNPRLGLQWAPAAGVLVRATYGESFRAPALMELYSPQLFASNIVTRGAERVRNISKLGGNPDLGPETARSWTVGIDLEPRAISNLRLAVTAYETRFKDRIDRPLVSAPRGTILTDPAYAPFVRLTSAATNPDDLAALAELLASPLFNPALGVFAPAEYGAILDQRYVNTAGLTVRGVDAQASYALPAFGGRLQLSANGAWLLDYERAVTPAAPFVDFVGQVANPARFRSRVAADWTGGAWSLGAAWNHVSGFRDGAGGRIRAQDTVDALVRLTAPAEGRWAGLSATLSVRNLFDRAPPFYDNPSGFGLDAANADVVGRFVSLQLAKSW